MDALIALGIRNRFLLRWALIVRRAPTTPRSSTRWSRHAVTPGEQSSRFAGRYSRTRMYRPFGVQKTYRPHSLRNWLGLALEIERHGGADQILQRLLIASAARRSST